MATQANLDYVQKMFVAYLGRAASASAQEYYADLIDADAELGKAQLFDDLYNSAEGQALYGSMSVDQVIEQIFQNCFNRDPAFSGLTYYYDEIGAGTFNILEAAAVIANDASAEDAAILAAKQTAADKITTEMGSDADAVAAYAANAADARESLNKVTDSDSAAAYDGAAELAAVSTGNQIGSTFALASTADTVNGTSGNDTITGTSTTYNSTDLIIDASTTDQDAMTITATGDIGATPTVTNVETANFNLDSFTASGTTADAIFEVKADNISGADLINVNVTKDGSSITSATVTGAKTNSNIAFGSAITTAAVVTGAADNEAVTVSAPAASITANSAGTLTSATMTGSGAASTTTTFVSDSDGTLNATTTASDMTVTAAAAKNVTLTSAKDIDANTTDLTAATTVNLTAGNEVDVGLEAATTATIAAGSGGTGVVSQIDDAAGNTLTSLTLSGNGSSPTFDIGDSEGVATVTINGDQDVTVTTSAANVGALTNDQLTVTDNSSATSTMTLTGTGDVDTSVIGTDVIKISGDNTGTIETGSGQTLTVTVDQTSLKLDGADASAASNSLTVILDDGTNTTGAAAVDLTALTVTDITNLTIDASKDATTASTITAITATADNTNITVEAGAKGVTFGNAGTSDLSGATGGGTLTVNSTGAVSVTTHTLDVSEFISTGGGAVTMTATSTEVNKVTTSSGIDSLTFDGLTDTLTVDSGAGNDTVTLTASTAASKNYTIDMGDGTGDTLTVGADALDLNNGATFTLTNAEKISFADNVVATTVGASLLDGKGYLLNHADETDTLVVTVELGTANSVDLSNLVVNGLNLTSADSFTVNGAAKTSAVTLTGANTMANTLTGGTKDDSITGGDAGDTLAGGAGDDTILGGGGNDTITGGDGGDSLTGGTGTNTYQYGSGDADSGETITFTAGTSATEKISVTSSADLSNINGGAQLAGLDNITIATGLTATFAAAQLSGLTSQTVTGVNGGGVETLAVVGGSGNETINMAGFTATDATITVDGAGGNDTITGAASGTTIDGGAGDDIIISGAGTDAITLGLGSNTVKFAGATSALNGSDTVADFQTGDKYDFSSVLSLGSGAIANATTSAGAITLATQTALAASGTSIAVTDQELYVAEVANEADIDTVAEIVTALADGGDMDAVDIAASSTTVLVVGGADDDTTHYIYAIVNDSTAAVTAGEITLLGTITTDITAGVDGLTTANFSF